MTEAQKLHIIIKGKLVLTFKMYEGQLAMMISILPVETGKAPCLFFQAINECMCAQVLVPPCILELVG